MASRKVSISKKEVKHIAWLAKIELSKEEEEVFTQQFNDILSYFRKIDEVDTAEVPPTYHPLELENVFRPDEVVGSLPKDKALQNAPRLKGSFVKAPRIV